MIYFQICYKISDRGDKMKKILLKNANLVLENKIEKATVLICEDKIEKIFSKDLDLSEIVYDDLIDLEGKYLGPAFVDVHVHGADGADAMDIDEEALRRISKYLCFAKKCLTP